METINDFSTIQPLEPGVFASEEHILDDFGPRHRHTLCALSHHSRLKRFSVHKLGGYPDLERSAHLGRRSNLASLHLEFCRDRSRYTLPCRCTSAPCRTGALSIRKKSDVCGRNADLIRRDSILRIPCSSCVCRRFLCICQRGDITD